ncbi:hypothetical protein ONA91_04600 [Micromonospora sp. DR5-3]|uniref:hypothetical protein n=1 Tax=unclassified Micromonospora TaxID=2617518 RepID=UPI0011D90CAF|nr:MULTISPECIES: hypothetical protein [unclassified Micromonospora]MCW3813738.1 hypothetical protein [Micromonospora sp. DR5-3]TYC25574.1 hypothetical protein FXF52_03900 [Micromonospora sp. MP36]
MPEPDDAAEVNVPARSRRPRVWLLSAAAVVCLLGVLIWLVDPFKTDAQRDVSQIKVRGYERVHDYIDFGTGPARERAAVAVFVGPPDDKVLTRVSGPGLVVNAETEDAGIRNSDLIGHGIWHGCGVRVERWRTNATPLRHFELTAEQLAEVRAARLSVLSVSVGCIP